MPIATSVLIGTIAVAAGTGAAGVYAAHRTGEASDNAANLAQRGAADQRTFLEQQDEKARADALRVQEEDTRRYEQQQAFAQQQAAEKKRQDDAALLLQQQTAAEQKRQADLVDERNRLDAAERQREYDTTLANTRAQQDRAQALVDERTARLAPYRQFGIDASNTLAGLLGLPRIAGPSTSGGAASADPHSRAAATAPAPQTLGDLLPSRPADVPAAAATADPHAVAAALPTAAAWTAPTATPSTDPMVRVQGPDGSLRVVPLSLARGYEQHGAQILGAA